MPTVLRLAEIREILSWNKPFTIEGARPRKILYLFCYRYTTRAIYQV